MVGWFKRASLGLFAAVVSLSSAASAQVLQPTPGGVVVPVLDPGVTTCTNKNVEVCLDESEGDPSLIDAQADALVAPETFQPTCQLTFTPIVKGGSIYDVFGWYNVKPIAGEPTKFVMPTLAQLYGMFVANDFKTGAQLAGQSVVLDLEVERQAGRYTGGQIAFFLASGAGALSIDPDTHKITGTPSFIFHTQHSLNAGSTDTTTHYNVLTWESLAKENTFYFGWEDLPANDAAVDNDFDDFVFSVEGVQCGGGGQPCETGLLGVCAAGVQQCTKGVMACVQSIQAGAEECNALDDDCNGEVDDGQLCDDAEICHRGRCVPECGTGEFRCPEGTTCEQGLCVEAACAGIECPAGQVCEAGACVDSCTGIVCPHDRACRNGACVDPCAGIECDEGLSCKLGVCTSCACSGCGEAGVCHENQCVDSGCEGQTCAENTHCEMGACKDDCEGVLCPEGQLCSAGECIADASVSGPDGGGGTGGIVINTGGSTSSTGGASGGGSSSSGAAREVPPATTCACRVAGTPASDRAALLALALFGLALRRRSARRHSN